MTDTYTRAAASALRLLTKYGKTVQLRSVTTGDYDTDTSSVATTSVDRNRKAALFDVERINYGIGLRNGLQIQEGDRQCYMDASGVAPTPEDKIVDGTLVYNILEIKELNPAGTPVMFTLLIRR